MGKKFRCGRLLLTRDGRVKKIELGNGGGTRTCDWPDDRMTFDDVHKQLLTVFSLTDKQQSTSLYDFQHQPLDLKQFPTFADYINKYGLNRNSTVVYLCISERGDDLPRRVETKQNDVIALPVVKVEADSESEETQPASPRLSTSEYSFVQASNELMKNVRELNHQHPEHKALVQLFENICLIQGYVFSIILPLQQQKPEDQSNATEVTLYLNNLNNVYDIFETTKSLLRRCADHFRQERLYSTIRSSFFQFYNNVKIVRNRWMTSTESKPTPTTSSRSPRVSAKRRKSSGKGSRSKDQSNYRIFHSLISTFEYLIRSSKTRRQLPLREYLLSAVKKVKTMASGLDLAKEKSITGAKKVLTAIETQVSKRYQELEADPFLAHSLRSLQKSRRSVSRVIRAVLTSLYRYQIELSQERSEKTS